ncbi:hypothetical protein P175DRAFT_0169124 [Aspergillus ochraceoroseus IBT 24754]|uniref:Uncharacterized protein n=1 Tax=Aspergillus ochraceoroseus IBT 24754 TaxID=1392256 RepID=A0A2T5M4C7_9EURO|nr:uncharacterized protein P175DRAFT_0169124 [Aspergillus ochraceoroseus IBT 24754]PTU23374.1 hypothetical protein P175DRAFT_0169124 [Aspergillus ochraceoroseus IBT 24754]
MNTTTPAHHAFVKSWDGAELCFGSAKLVVSSVVLFAWFPDGCTCMYFNSNRSLSRYLGIYIYIYIYMPAPKLTGVPTYLCSYLRQGLIDGRQTINNLEN